MKRIYLFVGAGLVVALLVVFGWSVASIGAADQQRPFKATSFEFVTSEGVIEGSECPALDVFTEGSGNGTHLGQFTITRHHCFTPPDHPEFNGSVFHDGTWEITSAYGDKLWGTYTGELQPTEFGDAGPIRGIITSLSTIDGGTGLFEDAQGDYQLVGDYDLIAKEGDFEFEGWISY